MSQSVTKEEFAAAMETFRRSGSPEAIVTIEQRIEGAVSEALAQRLPVITAELLRQVQDRQRRML